MKLKPIIASLLETDAYKFNMGALIHKEFPTYMTKWDFKCRNSNVKFTPEMVQEIRDQIDCFCTLKFTQDELDYLRKEFTWLPEAYIQYLKHWQADRSFIKINEGNVQAYNDCGLAIEAYGPWYDVSFFEIPVLAIVNEVYFAFKFGVGAKDIEFQKSTIEKFSHLHASVDANTVDYSEDYKKNHPYVIGTFSEFGLRRRYSGDMQDWLIKYIVNEKIPGFVGTSNVYLAKKYGVKAVGTQAHELFQGIGQGDPRKNPAYTNEYVMKYWTDFYGIKNGIVLSDIFQHDIFLMDFNEKYATLFSGVRHDSGDPIEWGEQMIAHYKKLGIDPITKTLLFSDSLDFEKATILKKHFTGKCKVAFGIGTYLAGIQDETPLNIVMKMTECNGMPVAKLSNNPSKSMCRDKNHIDYLMRALDWRRKYEKRI